MAEGQIMWKETLVGLAVKVGVTAVFVGLLVWAIDSQVQRNINGDITGAGALNASLIAPRDCFQEPKTEVPFSSVNAVPCDQSHTAQAYGGFAYPVEPIVIGGTASASAVFAVPAAEDIEAKARPECTKQRADAVDMAKVPPGAQNDILYPDARSWQGGDHVILCVISSDTPWTGSLLKPVS